MAGPTTLDLFVPGEKVLYSGEYILVDTQRNRQGLEIITLDEGETFPELNPQFDDLCFMLNDTCLDEPCSIYVDPHGGNS